MARAVFPPLSGPAGAGLFIAAAVAWTWPALRVAATSGEILGRQRDALATVSFIDAARRVGFHRVDELGTWPVGNPWYHPDSWTLALVSVAAWFVEPARLHAMVALGGVVAMGLAAERVARSIGAASPWSWIAAVGFAFSAFSSTALLEGYAYHLLNPWTPLAVYGAWKVGQPDGRMVHAALTTAGFAGALLTTAYVGLATAIAVAVIGVAAVWSAGAARAAGTASGPPPGASGTGNTPAVKSALSRILALAAGCALVGAAYALDFGAHPVVGLTTDATVQGSSASLVDLLPPGPAVDSEGSSQTAMLSASILVLAAAAPVVLRKRKGWRGLLAAGLVGLVLSLGPHLALDHSATNIPLPLSILMELPGSSLFRFPTRLGWAWAICGSLVAALVATELGRTRGRAAALLLALPLFDAFVGLGLPERQRTAIAATPSVYGTSSGAVLDLFPGEMDPGFGLLWYSRLACTAQVGHQRPIPYDCIGTSGDPGALMAERVRDALLTGATLPEPTPASIAFHPDFFRPNDRATLRAALERYDATPAESKDGGEYVVLFDLGD